MLCQYLESVVDDAVNKWLQDDMTDDEKFCASLLRSPDGIPNWENCF
jgi:hypothetical protein